MGVAFEVELGGGRGAWRALDAECTFGVGARQSQQPQRGTFVVCTFVVPALRLRIADFQRGMWRAMAFEVDRWKFESTRVGWLGWGLRLRWSWVGGAALRARIADFQQW